ncbi:potential E3 ubiquitin-protein ligase ariadne-2-like [Oppia nitens]|uniref:potential E3 ubiquitin-protein ligase ariadne-2-like n=1 Tax=Oppia nitens TaxID=1686743 RepID=UPI0023D9DA7A|nr:potential E3 ubiquitin-protein ligase ariadne-2-like [Oppia nitens]
MSADKQMDEEMYSSSDEDCFNDYYDIHDDNDDDETDNCSLKRDPEYFEYECLTIEEVERYFNESVELICGAIQVNPSLAKLMLHTMEWNVDQVIHRYRTDCNKLLRDARIKPQTRISCSQNTDSTQSIPSSSVSSSISQTTQTFRSRVSFVLCNVCYQSCPAEYHKCLSCGHSYCKECWSNHLEVHILNGVTTNIECMASNCRILVTEDFALNLLTTKLSLREKYQQFAFRDYVKSHPKLRYCVGLNCDVIIRSKEPAAKRVICSECKSSYCFQCGGDYHTPTHCNTIKLWLTKCEDDSETANYISAHTKDCPKCHICIEKNGGCNHMQCYSCKHDFCWMCLGDWKTHGSEYYECSRYKENPNIVNESAHAQAREALKKYLFYYERWDNHARSLRLEEQTLQRIKQRIHEKVMKNMGTWIDWQYLLDAATLLAKCRYTLQYTYPFAYFMDSGPRKALFEYQQSQLEAEIENLSWKVERAETTDRGDLQNQMDIAEKRRAILLKDFLA